MKKKISIICLLLLAKMLLSQDEKSFIRLVQNASAIPQDTMAHYLPSYNMSDKDEFQGEGISSVDTDLLLMNIVHFHKEGVREIFLVLDKYSSVVDALFFDRIDKKEPNLNKEIFQCNGISNTIYSYSFEMKDGSALLSLDKSLKIISLEKWIMDENGCFILQRKENPSSYYSPCD